MQERYCSYKRSTITYLQGGTGTRVLLCLHGFGESANSFRFLEAELGDRFTIYAVDLPWHGHTLWEEGLSLTQETFLAVLKQMIPGFETRSITLLGYSMGGRVALQVLQQLPAQIEKLVLLAPDGLRMNPWYYLATQTRWGNQLFRYTMNHPRWFQQLANLLRRTRCINRSIAKFVHHYIDRASVREHLYRVWTTMHAFRPHLKTIRTEIIKRRIPVALVFGRYDRVIASKYGRKFQKGAESYIAIHELQEGHQLLRPKHHDFIISLLQQV
jgi:pimeloyl-ACP methyl ester carboxylesterase